MNDDLISRKALIAEYDRVHIGPPGGARKLMEDAPAVDAVQVVRCKDCKMWRRRKRGHIGFVDSPIGYCPLMDVEQNHNNFCSYGIRRETNETD